MAQKGSSAGAPRRTLARLYPIAEGRVLVYRYASPERERGKPGTSRMTFTEVRREGGAVRAKLTEVIGNGEEWGKWVYDVRRGSAELRQKTSGADEVLLKGPIRKGTAWQSEVYEVEIAAVAERVKVPAGTFKCVRVSYWNEDVGGGSRWYAPGVGLVKAEQRGEHLPFDYKLVRIEEGGKRGRTARG